MEGYLSLWVGVFIGWEPHYVLLTEDIITIFKDKGKAEVASVSLKIAKIQSIPEDPLRIVINSGTKELHFKLHTSSERNKWLEAFKKAKNEIDSQISYRASTQPAAETKNFFSTPSPNKFLRESQISDVNKKLATLRSKQASLDLTARILEPEIKKNPQLAYLVSNLVNLSREFEETVTECVHNFERENTSVCALITEMNGTDAHQKNASSSRTVKARDNQFNDANWGRSSGQKETFNPRQQRNYSSGDYETPFHSFVEEDKEAERRELEGRAARNTGSKEIFVKEYSRQYSKEEAENLFNEIEDYNFSLNHRTSELVTETLKKKDSFVLQLHATCEVERAPHPIIASLLEKNEAFRDINFLDEIERDTLPQLQNPKTNYSFKELLEIIRAYFDRKVERFSLPIWVNEPLGMLQKLCEFLEHYEILTKANQIQDSCLRLAYICVFAVSSYGATINRVRKPFNPLLGETFEYIPPDGSFKFISEQVSHHPPISAAYAEGPAFKIWMDSDNKMKLKLNSLELSPKSHVQIVLNRSKDQIVYQRAHLTVKNLFFGKRYIENHGEIHFKNPKTGETAVLCLKQRGWNNRGAYELEGNVLAADGKAKYKIVGKWDSEIRILDTGGKEVFKWQRPSPMKTYEKMYFFSRFALQLNHITPSLMQKIPPTDTRLRPDQRLLEMGRIEAANREKVRLEERQRAFEKYCETAGKPHKPKWFTATTSPATNEKYYEYLGSYWEVRRSGGFSVVPNLFTDDPIGKN